MKTEKGDEPGRRAAGVILARRAAPQGEPEWLVLRNRKLGHWGFAKGHLDEGEDELAGALREVREETGLLPRLDPVFREAIRYEVPATKKRPAALKEVVYYLGVVPATADVAVSEEHDRVEWLAGALVLERLEHDTLRAVFRHAQGFLASRV